MFLVGCVVHITRFIVGFIVQFHSAVITYNCILFIYFFCLLKQCNDFVNMSCQKSFQFRTPIAKQFKRDNAGHEEATINNAATVQSSINPVGI